MADFDPRTPPLVPYTYADPALIDPTNDSRARYRFLSNNCMALAELLKRVPKNSHDQGIFGEGDERDLKSHVCGTTACALGWAALGHVVDGLQYHISEPSVCSWSNYATLWEYAPVVNGEVTDWDIAGKRFFGEYAMEEIFYNTHRTKAQTIQALYREAERLCELAKIFPPE